MKMTMKNSVKFPEIRSINVHLKTLFGPVAGLRHEFVFESGSETVFPMRLKFALPKGAAIYAFEVSGGAESVKSVPGRSGAGDAAAELVQLDAARCELRLYRSPKSGGRILVTVFSSVTLSGTDSGYAIDIPLYTPKGRFFEPADSEVRVKAVVSAEVNIKAGRIYSPTHKFEINAAPNGCAVLSKPGSGGVFRLCIEDPDEEMDVCYAYRLPGAAFGREIHCLYRIMPAFDAENITVTHAAPGVFYMLPQKIRTLEKGTPVTVTLGTATQIPYSFELRTEDGLRRELKIKNVIKTEDAAVSRIFARECIEEMYRCILRGDVAPDSVIKLKASAAKLADDAGILCPENNCSVLIFEDGRELTGAPVRVSVRQNLHGFDEEGAAFSDPDGAAGRKLLENALRALLCCVRKDGSITSPFENSRRAAVEQTMYAAAAIRAAAERYPEYRSVFLKADEFLRTADAETNIVVFGENDLINTVSSVEQMDVRGLSRLILSLLYA